MTLSNDALYLLGHPIKHSKSPAMYNALYKKLGLDWNYGLMDCSREDEARQFVQKMDFRSINITTPYKPLAFEEATIKAASAKLARGASMVVRKGETLIAYNMDGEGCVSYLERTGFDFQKTTVVVCGTGPTALAILHSCALAGAAEVVLLSRRKEKSDRVLGRYATEFNKLAHATIDLPALHEGRKTFRHVWENTQFTSASYRSSSEVISCADLVINATPLGMGEHDKAPFNTDLLSSSQTVFDVVYGHGETSLTKEATQKGCTVYDGAGMLVAQAVESALTVLEIAEKDISFSRNEIFDIMATAADFSL